jgi:hypothetical protein
MPNNYVISSEGELYHYGVPGMKWGRRKSQPSTSGNGRYKNKLKNSISNKIAEKKKQNKERLENDIAKSTLGEGGVELLKRKREYIERRKKADAYLAAKGKDKVKLILKEIGEEVAKGPIDADGKRHPIDKRTGNI